MAGYGWVGKGIASRLRGHGAHVAVVEVDPVRALEALMDGFEVMTVDQAAPWGELFITATGNINVFRREHFVAMRDGAILANSGHFDAELDLVALRALAEGHVREVRENVQEFDLGAEEAPPHRRGPARQPRRGRGPPGRGHGHELRQPGALRRVRRGATMRSSSRRSTSCPRRSTPRSPGSSSRPSASRSTPMTDEQSRYVTTWQSGT